MIRKIVSWCRTYSRTTETETVICSPRRAFRHNLPRPISCPVRSQTRWRWGENTVMKLTVTNSHTHQPNLQILWVGRTCSAHAQACLAAPQIRGAVSETEGVWPSRCGSIIYDYGLAWATINYRTTTVSDRDTLCLDYGSSKSCFSPSRDGRAVLACVLVLQC